MVRIPTWVRFSATATRGDWIRFIAKVLGAGFVTFVLVTVVAVEITERPSFCRTCHNMEPYYQSWATSKHKDVLCIDCHYEPGIRSTVIGKFQGIRQVVVYFTGGAGTRPWAEVSDLSCLRSGCHETRLLAGVVDFNGIRFDHAPHLLEMRRGKKLRCTSCHSQIVQGEHVTVTTATCILCHFKDEPVGQPVGGCLGCHHVPSDTIALPGGLVHDHKKVVERKIPCVSCHASATTGDGFVPRSRCYVCHNIPIDGYLRQPEFLHRKHVTEHKVECTDCHEEITHGYDSQRRSAALNCVACHEGKHRATVALAEGGIALALGDTQPHVGPMLAARVECISCHLDTQGVHPRYTGTTRVASEKGCSDCHGSHGPGVLRNWKAFFARRIPQVERALAASRAPESSRRQAREFIETVRLGRAVHNPSLARNLLDAAERLARGETAAVRRPVAEQVPGAGLDCSYCHLGPPEGAIPFQGLSFPHAPHVNRVRIACHQCHEAATNAFPTGAHGRVRIERKDCESCHHWQTKRCESCHGTGPEAALDWNGISFLHAPHIRRGVACLTCHEQQAGRTMGIGISLPACATCHHKNENAACGKCHRDNGPEFAAFRQARIPHRRHVETGLGCRDCHTPTANGIRLVSPAPCSTCHHSNEIFHDCAACHGRGPEAVTIAGRRMPHQMHQDAGAACLDCHGITPSGFVIQPVCETCHGEDMRRPAGAPTPAPVEPAPAAPPAAPHEAPAEAAPATPPAAPETAQ